jgi:hypothetical protein
MPVESIAVVGLEKVRLGWKPRSPLLPAPRAVTRERNEDSTPDRRKDCSTVAAI